MLSIVLLLQLVNILNLNIYVLLLINEVVIKLLTLNFILSHHLEYNQNSKLVD